MISPSQPEPAHSFVHNRFRKRQRLNVGQWHVTGSLLKAWHRFLASKKTLKAKTFSPTWKCCSQLVTIPGTFHNIHFHVVPFTCEALLWVLIHSVLTTPLQGDTGITPIFWWGQWGPVGQPAQGYLSTKWQSWKLNSEDILSARRCYGMPSTKGALSPPASVTFLKIHSLLVATKSFIIFKNTCKKIDSFDIPEQSYGTGA